jgi:CubicO group peptidase (beta-lactamase class C family)
MNRAEPEAVGLSSERLERIRPVIQNYIDRRIIAGALTLVARHGKIAHLECMGQMDLEAGKAMPPDAIFRIYSMTKPVTSVAALMLVEQGRLLLAEPISKYMPAFKTARVFVGHTEAGDVLTTLEREPTVHDLFRHTAGLGYGLFMDSLVEDMYRAAGLMAPLGRLRVPLTEMAQRLALLPFANQPGACWRYSMATDMLGYLVQLIADMPFDVFLAEKIFKPLGMDDTGFYVSADKVERFCACYTPAQTGGLMLVDAPAKSVFLKADTPPSGGGGLVSTTADYLRFAQLLLNGGELDGVRLLGRKTIQVMTTNHLSPALLPIRIGPEARPGVGFGLGVSVTLNYDAGMLNSVGAYGWGGAAGTFFRVDPQEDLIYMYMPQLMGGVEPIAAVFQNVVYQALLD